MHKILIIEDNMEVAKLLNDRFIAEGFETAVCYDAYQGVEFSHKTKPDVILLDLMIPAGGGLNVLRNLRMSGFTKFTPIVVLTGSRNPQDQEKAKELGANAYLGKPFDSGELVGIVRSFLKGEA